MQSLIHGTEERLVLLTTGLARMEGENVMYTRASDNHPVAIFTEHRTPSRICVVTGTGERDCCSSDLGSP
jgi:hypothetical protein